MFDARSILEHLVRGGGQGQAPQQAPAGGIGSIGDILGKLGEAMGQQPGQGQRGAPVPGGGLGDILGKIGEAMGQPPARNMVPEDRRGQEPQRGPSGGAGAGGLGGLEEILKNMLPGGGMQPGASHQQGGGQPHNQGTQDGGGLLDVLRQVLGQATQGVREGAGRIDDATGASGHMRDAVGRATGKNPDEVLAQLKELIEKNQLGAGAVAGGLGALVLGTRTGRSLAGKALKIGGLALIGGLAYKALQNYQQGRPLITGAGGQQPALAEAPRGSGFEAAAVSNEAAALYIRAMIAAAAADGRIDQAEQQKILGGLKQAGLDAEAEEFLAAELNKPATVDDLVRAVGSEAEAVQMFTAARVAIDLDTAEEHEFLVALAQSLGLDGNLVAHIDAEARAAA
jgi:uncharacterized membrane protein YebE (DUF533 family)